MASLGNNSTPMFVVCPFNISHIILASRLQYHINRDHPEAADTAYRPPYMLQAHIPSCPHRNNDEQFRGYDESISQPLQVRVPQSRNSNIEYFDESHPEMNE